MKIGFIGCGRAGASFAKTVGEKYPVVLFSEEKGDCIEAAKSIKDACVAETSEELVEASDMIFVTVPDGSIKKVWDEISCYAKEKTVCHMSGALSSEEAFPESVKSASVHPMMAIPDKNTDLKKAFFTIEGNAKSEIEKLLKGLGISFVSIDMNKKKLYHASCVMASNNVIALIKTAADMLGECGMEKESALKALEGLVLKNVCNVFKMGFEGALTGPVDRNDIKTVQKHLEVLGDEKELYILLARKLVEIAKNKNKASDYREMEDILK